MKPVIAFAFLLTTFTSLCAQTPEDLARDVQANATSVAALRSVIQKHAASKDTTTYWAYKEKTTGFFQQQKLFQSFVYRDPSAKKDSPGKTMNLFVTYTGDTVRYIKLESFHYEFNQTLAGIQRLVYYIDSVYSNNLLSNYNAAHKSNFTFADLYEDECDCFGTIGRPNEQSTYIKKDGSRGNVFYGHDFAEFWPSLRDRDHAAIVKNCRSFNIIRRAFGAFCLYILQQQGEPLSWEEKELMQKILNSTEKINYCAMCKRYDSVQINKLLTPQELKDLYIYLYSGN
jgi:hypothetical protein